MNRPASFLLGALAFGLTGGAAPASAQYPRYAGPERLAPTAPGYPHLDPYHADRPAYPYGPPPGYGRPYDPGYGQPYGPGSNRPYLPEDPPFGAYPTTPGYGPPTYHNAYRPPFPGPVPDIVPGFGPPGPAGSPQLMRLADALAGQVNEFLQVFTPTADVVPEGRRFLADARRLSDDVGRFRQLVAGGVPPARLSQELRGIEGSWQRLQQRTQRIARGRTGPNIQQIGLMGNTLQQMRLVLP